MTIKSLCAEYFRNLDIPLVEIAHGITILHGDNAQGKTNFLEAVYFCALGRPLRADTGKDFLPVGIPGKDVGYAHVRAEFGDSRFTVDARIVQHQGKYVKAISVDRVPIKNTRELFGRVPVVSFSPEDLQLVKAGPALRRRFMDIEICQLSQVYYKDLRAYTRALRQRNHLLKMAKRDPLREAELAVWDAQLVENGMRVMKARGAFVEKIARLAKEIYGEITQKKEILTMEYHPGAADEKAFAAALERSRVRDIALGATSAGVHRDDIYFGIRGQAARSFGSQGQQRTAALAVKLAEISLIQDRLGTTPILLLDDVFSELDSTRRKYLLEHLKGGQVIITCTGLEEAVTNMKESYNVIHIKNGEVYKR